ncbi:MAG: GNAT family N-acetyltransferase [Chloroflexi bacterium]|nr:GNAT family N-acetyltransferase [Chloroflexota bacterium]MDA1002764.1 GNAT family N-acetyltransferase [Chloroflexota bacterium]
MITTDRLALRALSVELLDAFAAGDRPRVATLGGFSVAHPIDERDRAHARTRAAELRADPTRAPWLSRAIVEHTSNTMVGRVGFHDRPNGAGEVEIGYAVFTPYRRRGYAREAAAELIAWAEARGVARVIASVGPWNDASLRVIARLGFERTGERMDERDGLEHVFVRESRSRGTASVAAAGEGVR